MAGHERAETLLRLTAETELRRALAYPVTGSAWAVASARHAASAMRPQVRRAASTMTPLIWSTARASPALRHVTVPVDWQASP
jgi:hypothetical protein